MGALLSSLLSYLFPADPPDQLQTNDLAEVLQLLKRHRYSGVSYYNLGLYLGLSSTTLDVITFNNKSDVTSCLRECLKAWLQKADKVEYTKGGPTIYSLVSALRELGENAVADGIDMEKHPACKIFACYSAEQSLLAALPNLIILLHTAKLIKEILPTNVQGEALLIEIKEAICKDCLKLEAFSEILCQVKTTVAIGRAIKKETKKVFCSNDPLMINGNNAEELKIYLPQSIINEFKTMRLKFGETFLSVKDIMKKNPTALEKIRDTLNFSYRALKPQITQCQDIKSILELISENCSLNDISMLEFFVTQSKVDELVRIIQEYNEAIKKFSETKLSEYLEGELSYASPLQCERIIIVVDRSTDDYTLDDVRRLSANTFHELSQHVRLNVIREGDSFTITCSFPLILSEQLITAALNNIDVLKENKVKRLTIGYCTVYEVKDTSNPTTTEMDEYTSSLSTSSGLMKQLMLSLSVQLINCKKEESMIMKEEAESLKEALDAKIKMLTASIAESDRFKRVADEAITRKKSGSINQDTENKDEEKTEKLQPMKKTLQQKMSFEIDSLRIELQQERDKSKKEIELSQKKMAIMNSQLIEKDKQMTEMREREQILLMKIENLRKVPQQENPLIFNDDIYGDITIDHPLIIKIVQTRQFQRLKNIKQIGYTYQNIPKANYSRLQHSIGMYFFAGEYVKQLQKRQPELNITESDVLCVQIAALCYNLGHGPFSHIFGLFLKEVFPKGNKPWEKVSEASVMMFNHMIEENDEVKDLLKEFLDNYEEDIAFIKELIQGARTGQRKGKEFLYEIVVNKTSGLDVCMIDDTTRDAAVLGMKINFKWRVFLSKVEVRNDNGERHIFFQKDDLETCNDLFRARHTLFRKLYYLRKKRIAAVMIKRILVKSDKKPIIRDGDSHVTISEATKSMFTYTQLNDGILNTIKILVDEPEVRILLDCLDTMKVIGQIGYVTPTDDWNANKIKEHIIKSTKSYVSGQLIIDPIKNGYENWESYTQLYYTSDDKTGKWDHDWARPPPYATKAPLRIFLVSGDMNLIKEVQKVLQDLIKSIPLNGKTYPDDKNCDLMPHLPLQTTEASPLAQVS